MPVIAVIGGQWGDEGKGRVIDLLAENAEVVARFSGGANAGHTVVNQRGRFALHLVPSGIFNPQAICIIGNGVAVDPASLLEEIATLQRAGVSTERLYVSDRAHLVMPYHQLFDQLEEERLGQSALGTTRRGIGPAFADKAARLGIRLADLQDPKDFLERLAPILELKNAILTKVYGRPALGLEEVHTRYLDLGRQLRGYVRETHLLLQEALDQDKRVILEGAQGVMLDVDFGTYPYVTSSSPLAAGAAAGLGIPARLDRALGVYKVYATRVGAGPLPTELDDDMGAALREWGKEYGATTGRPRRCGWFDAVAARHSTRLSGFTDIALTKLDVLDRCPTIKVCTAYMLEGQAITTFPASSAALARCVPVYEELQGWLEPTQGVRRFSDLPPRARAYVKRLEQLLACPVGLISVGDSREQMVQRRTFRWHAAPAA
ncbi:MAG: adenylosuccinate synthase [Dehalococcoidia bacterium]|nr:adenylosuccinate synthase [Dehalococcoidia bacterium]